MSTIKTVHCIVDDTALTTNIQEIETWVLQGIVVLVVPLYTLERLHLLKKDVSQIGSNARKAVKFLDRMTSGKEGLPHEPIVLQGPDEQYATWQEVEAHYSTDHAAHSEKEASRSPQPSTAVLATKTDSKSENSAKRVSNSAGVLSQMLLDKLNFSGQPGVSSPASTPPLSPATSGPQSSKTSPEVKAAEMVGLDASPVPPTLKPLLNPVVWYMHEKPANEQESTVFLTNSADTQHLARDFQVLTKNIHQLRNMLGVEAAPVQEQTKAQKRISTSSATGSGAEQKTLFKYEEEASDDDELVFKPRGRGGATVVAAGRGAMHGSVRSKGGSTRSPRLSFSTPTQPQSNKPQIPVEEIDPNSFDRGSFGRGSTPLVNTANHPTNQYNGAPRGAIHRNGFNPAGASRGGHHNRSNGRGSDRGSARGRGRLFVP